MKYLLLAMMVLLSVPNATSAQERGQAMDAGSLLEACTRPDAAWISFCNGYMQAVHDAYYDGLDGRMTPICAPPGTTRAMLADTFARSATAMLREEPSLASAHGVSVAYAIFKRAFPCR